jgi:hypothetical protein
MTTLSQSIPVLGGIWFSDWRKVRLKPQRRFSDGEREREREKERWSLGNWS